MITSRIIATGAGIPERVVTNEELTKIVDTSDEWITQRTGIKERHIATGEDLSDLATTAAKQIIDRSGIEPNDIELIIVATCTPDYGTPCVACVVQKNIEAANAVCFDVKAACSGFMFAVSIADKYIRSGMYKNALVIGAEILSKVTDWTDRSTCVLFGDGAAGALLECSEDDGIICEELGSQGDLYEVLTNTYTPPANVFNDVKPLEKIDTIHMDGREVFKFATKKLQSSITNVLEKSQLSIDDVKYVVPHQANYRIVEVVAKKLDIPMDKFYMNMERFGNTSAASIPTALNEMVENDLIERGDRIMFAGFGGGLSWGTILLTW